jgi:hypothetical protein
MSYEKMNFEHDHVSSDLVCVLPDQPQCWLIHPTTRLRNRSGCNKNLCCTSKNVKEEMKEDAISDCYNSSINLAYFKSNCMVEELLKKLIVLNK